MKCFYHYEKDAVATCSNCGVGLCPDCIFNYNPPLCNRCYLDEIKLAKKEILKRFAFSLLIIIIVHFYIFPFSSDGNTVPEINEYGIKLIFLKFYMRYTFASIPWGMDLLNQWLPKVKVRMNLLVLLIWFSIKLNLSLFIGIFVAPFKIYKDIKNYINYSKLEKSLRMKFI